MQQEPYEDHGSRGATIIDPFGHRWMLSGPITGAAVPIQHGDVGYVSVWTPDADRAAAFYGHVLGLGVRPGHPSGHQHQAAHRASTACRVTPRCSAATRWPIWRVRDSAIVDAGGTVDELRGVRLRAPVRRDRSGRHQLRGVPARAGHRPPGTRMVLGQASFRTSPTRCADSAAFKAFYSGLLFWTFEPGRINDGWQVQGTHPDGGCRGRQRTGQ